MISSESQSTPTSSISLRALRATVAAAEFGSINRAARALRLSQPAVSTSIRSVEEAFSVALFDRSADGVSLTKPGEICLKRIRRGLDYLVRAEKESGGGRKNDSRPLRNAISNSHLIALIETADCGNMTLASRNIGLTLSAVARTVSHLEELVGTPLFERHQRRMVPTVAGGLLFRYGKLLFAELRYAHEELASLNNVMSGRLNVGCLPLSQTMLVPRTIDQLLKRYPELRFSLVEGPYTNLLTSLRCGDLDVIVGALRRPAPVEDVTETALFEEPLAVVARTGHPWSARRKISLKDLVRAEWVVPRYGTPTRGIFEKLFEDSRLTTPRNTIEASSLVAVRALLSKSDRLTIISLSQVEYEISAHFLQALPIRLTGTARPIGLTVRSNTSLSPALEVFLSELKVVSSEMCNSNPKMRCL